jgi:hypothetical protein
LSAPSQYQSIIIEHRIADFLNFPPLLFDSSSPNKYGFLGKLSVFWFQKTGSKVIMLQELMEKGISSFAIAFKEYAEK